MENIGTQGFSFDLPKNTPIERLRLVGRDNNGNKLSSAIQ
jgi:hypothetical protein